MKNKIIGGLVSSVLLLVLSVSAYAVGTTEYSLDELGMTAAMPSEYIVFTRDINENDPNLTEYGLTKDGLSALMDERNIYLNGWDENINQEIIVTMIDSLIGDFNLFSDTTLSTMASSFESEYAAIGTTVIKTEIYQHAQAKFLKIYISQPNGDSTAYGLQYYTVYDAKAINITMQSYSGEITSAQEKTLRSIVDSAVFNTAPQVASSDFTPTASFTYTDTKTDASFVVPANWVETELSKERDVLDVKFASLEEEGMTILYGSFDIWSEMTASERSGYSRSDVDNSIFTKAHVAEIFGLTNTGIITSTYGGREYYTATVTSSTEVYGMDFSLAMSHAILVDNGYIYMYQFSGTKDSEFFSDFESLLSSAKYKNQNTNSANIAKVSPALNIMLSLIVTIAVYTLPIALYRYVIRKSPVDTKKAKRITIIYGIFGFIVMSVIIFMINDGGAANGAILLWSYVNYRILIGGKASQDDVATHAVPYATPMENPIDMTCEILGCVDADTVENKPKILFCRKCGTKLMDDSDHCSHCGTEMEKEGIQ